MEQDKPILVRGLSRSGGTLMVTILDAHPDIAMSYELYPHLLVQENGDAPEMEYVIEILSKSKDLKKAGTKIKDRNVRVFFHRCLRSGLNYRNLIEFLQKHKDDAMDLMTLKGRLEFIKRCCSQKMDNQGKSRWGAKCTGAYRDYLSVFPDAKLINMIRDGRDVLASQLNTGNFKKNPKEVGESWSKNILKFHELVNKRDISAYEVKYENLATDPEKELKNICEFLELPYSNKILNFHKQNLTIFKSDTGHLSANRISKPIDTSRIGRWKKDLTNSQLKEFYSTAKNTLDLFGYLEQQTV